MTTQFKPQTGGRGIEWCDETRNATGGCLHDCRWEMPDGTTAICYAKELAESSQVKKFYPHGFEHHYFREGGLKTLHHGDEPLLIFVDSMSDMFAPNVPEEEVRSILAAMRKAPHHAFQSLTKAAPQLLKYAADFPPNLWVGVSSPPDWLMGKRLNQRQQEAMLRRSLEVLAEVQQQTGNLVWMSAEPVSWDLTGVIDRQHPLDWIVIGAASHGRKYFQPDKHHVRALLEVMDDTKTAVFYKGNLHELFRYPIGGGAQLNRWREDFPLWYRDGQVIPAVHRRQVNCQTYDWQLSRGYRPRKLADRKPLVV